MDTHTTPTPRTARTATVARMPHPATDPLEAAMRTLWAAGIGFTVVDEEPALAA